MKTWEESKKGAGWCWGEGGRAELERVASREGRGVKSKGEEEREEGENRLQP